LTLRLKAEADGSWSGAASLLSELAEKPMAQLLSEVLAEDRPVPNPQQQLNDIVLMLRNQFIERQMAAIVQKTADPNVPETERVDLLRSIQELKGAKARALSALGEA